MATSFNRLFIKLAFRLIYCFKERKNIKSTWLWLMILLYLPFLGFILYMFLALTIER
ncbi:PLDc N-terminal domain-containing protein [Fenollaria sporofastidiosus]|uniref:PLDc N-terminal domain-containing protein n=1 Tax=Fenollaria sporofastidiosus TaxID=2811778 RepID=UPI001C008243